MEKKRIAQACFPFRCVRRSNPNPCQSDRQTSSGKMAGDMDTQRAANGAHASEDADMRKKESTAGWAWKTTMALAGHGALRSGPVHAHGMHGKLGNGKDRIDPRTPRGGANQTRPCVKREDAHAETKR